MTTTTTTTTIILTTPNNSITTASTTTGLFTETTTPIPSNIFYGCIPRENKCEVNGTANIGRSNRTINSCCNSTNNCNRASGGGGGGGSGDSGLSGGAVAGIVIGSVAGVGILGGGAAFAWKKKGKKTGGSSSVDE
jgi:hypothetical protein